MAAEGWIYRHRVLVSLLVPFLVLAAALGAIVPWRPSIQTTHEVWLPEDYYEQSASAKGELADDWLRGPAVEVEEEVFRNVEFDQTLVSIGITNDNLETVFLTYVGKQDNRPPLFLQIGIKKSFKFGYEAASWELQATQLTIFYERGYFGPVVVGVMLLILSVLGGLSMYKALD